MSKPVIREGGPEPKAAKTSAPRSTPSTSTAKKPVTIAVPPPEEEQPTSAQPVPSAEAGFSPTHSIASTIPPPPAPVDEPETRTDAGRKAPRGAAPTKSSKNFITDVTPKTREVELPVTIPPQPAFDMSTVKQPSGYVLGDCRGKETLEALFRTGLVGMTDQPLQTGKVLHPDCDEYRGKIRLLVTGYNLVAQIMRENEEDGTKFWDKVSFLSLPIPAPGARQDAFTMAKKGRLEKNFVLQGCQDSPSVMTEDGKLTFEITIDKTQFQFPLPDSMPVPPPPKEKDSDAVKGSKSKKLK